MARVRLRIGLPGDRPGNRGRLNWKRVLLALAGLCVFIVLIVVAIRAIFGAGGGPAAAPRPAGEIPEAVDPEPAGPALTEEKIVIPPGTTLADLLGRRDFDPREIHRLRESVKPVYDLGRIRAGQELRLISLPGEPWAALEYDIDPARYLVVRNGEAGIEAEIKEYPFEVVTAFVHGVIEDSLIGALNRAGEQDALALDLVERCFGWDIDFNTDLRKGDSFRIVFEKKFLNGRFAGYRDILAAEFVNAGTAYRAFRFTYPDTGASDYFDENGGSRRKDFLRSPIKFARITSRFSNSRFHPIHKIYRPHYGVDYAAPIGTPVQATADGEVILAGRNGGAGNMVRLRHKNRYETAYLHLSRFGPRVRKGARIKGGDVVGYVGSSGDSTGPHLDYRIYHYGKPVNPLGHKFKPADPLRAGFEEVFRKDVERLSFLLDPSRITALVAPALTF
jgi:murein DD-endopeptidase MepM/ murein hydrolase activator NlpD